jgi:hypothetical protein
MSINYLPMRDRIPAFETITELAALTGYTFERLGQLLGVSHTTVYHWKSRTVQNISAAHVINNVRKLKEAILTGSPLPSPHVPDQKDCRFEKLNAARRAVYSTHVHSIDDIGDAWDITPLNAIIPGGENGTQTVTISNLQEIGAYLMGDFQYYTEGEIEAVKKIGRRTIAVIRQFLQLHGADFMRPGPGYTNRTPKQLAKIYTRRPHCYRLPPKHLRAWRSDKPKNYHRIT